MRPLSCDQFNQAGDSVWIGHSCTLNGHPAKIKGRSCAHRLVIESDDGCEMADFTYSHVQKVMNRFRDRGQFVATR